MKTKFAAISPDIAIQIARVIGQCDFRTTVSRYTTIPDAPWIITVGESGWRRHLIVTETSNGICGPDAELAVLATSESDKFGYDIRTDRVDRAIRLSSLISGGYVGVKKVLYQNKKTSLEKVTEYVIERVLGGNDETGAGALTARTMALEAIAHQPDRYLEHAREMLTRQGGWVDGAITAWNDANISIDDPDAAAKHIMEAVEKRFGSHTVPA